MSYVRFWNPVCVRVRSRSLRKSWMTWRWHCSNLPIKITVAPSRLKSWRQSWRTFLKLWRTSPSGGTRLFDCYYKRDDIQINSTIASMIFVYYNYLPVTLITFHLAKKMVSNEANHCAHLSITNRDVPLMNELGFWVFEFWTQRLTEWFNDSLMKTIITCLDTEWNCS